MMEDNNALAIGLVILMPMLHFLRETEPRRWLRARCPKISRINKVLSLTGSSRWRSRLRCCAGLKL